MPKAKMPIVFDLKELQNYAQKGRKAVKEFDRFVEGLARKAGELYTGYLVEATPVSDGNLRNQWKVKSVQKEPDGYLVTLVNGAQYASYVNDGHMANEPGVAFRFVPGEWRADKFQYIPGHKTGMVLRQQWIKGLFFVEKATDLFEKELPKFCERELEAFIRKCEL